MAVVVKTPLMASHQLTVDLNFSKALQERLTTLVDGYRRPRKVYLRIKDGAGVKQYPTMTLLSVEGNEKVLTIGGLGPAWHLGTPGGPGPIIRNKEFISGKNFLDNPTFPEDLQLLYWKVGDGTKWEWNAAYHDADGQPGSAYVGGSPDDDDVLETREYPAEPGQQFLFFGWFIRGPGSLGRCRLRTIYHGRYITPNLAQPYSAWNPPEASDIELLSSDPTGILSGPVYRMQSDMPNLIPEFEFDGGVPSGAWNILSGGWGQGTDGGWNGPNYAYTDVDGGVGIAVLQSLLPLGIQAGQEYELRVVARANSGSPDSEGEVWLEVAMSASGSPPYDRVATEKLHGPAGSTDWNILLKTFTVPEEIPTGSMTALLYRVGGEAGRWDFDTATVFRKKGNIDQVIGPPIPGIPGRTYPWTIPYRVDSGVSSGRAQMRAALFGDGRPVLYVDGPELKGKKGGDPLQSATFDVTLPSGYDAWEPRLISEDIIGGSIWVGQGTIKDNDSSTIVFDELTGHLQPTWLLRERTTTAPVGTETVSFAIVAEQYGIGWLADDFVAVRWETPHSTHTEVLRAILTNNDTGLPLPITLGSVVDPGIIPYDVHVLNTYNRDFFNFFNDVVASPWGEWYIGNDDDLHWAPAGLLFDDHSPSSSTPVVLVPRDLDVVPDSISELSNDVTDQATHVEVIGAVVSMGGGRSMVIRAVAVVPIPPELDPEHNVIQRWKQISDASIDTMNFAKAVAADEAYREARPPISLTAKLNEMDAATAAALGLSERYPFRTGDIIYVFYPEASLEHESFETEVDGETVWPRPVQVLDMEKSHPKSDWIIEVEEPDGSTWNLPDIIWGPNETTLTLGDRLPVWKADPTGRASSQQYLDDRKNTRH